MAREHMKETVFIPSYRGEVHNPATEGEGPGDALWVLKLCDCSNISVCRGNPQGIFNGFHRFPSRTEKKRIGLVERPPLSGTVTAASHGKGLNSLRGGFPGGWMGSVVEGDTGTKKKIRQRFVKKKKER